MSQPVKISVVEDDAIFSRILKVRLTGLGYEVVSQFTSGEEAIKHLPEAWPHLMIMDILIEGGLDGVDTSLEIMDRFRIPTVFVSGATDERTIDRVNTVPGAEFVSKPFSDDDLRIAIQLALAKYRFIHQVQAREARFREVLTHVPGGIIATDAQGIITFANAGARALLGIDCPEGASIHLREVLRLTGASGAQVLEDPFEAVLRTGRTWRFPANTVLYANDHVKRPVVGNAGPLLDEDGQPAGMVLTLFHLAPDQRFLRFRSTGTF